MPCVGGPAAAQRNATFEALHCRNYQNLLAWSFTPLDGGRRNLWLEQSCHSAGDSNASEVPEILETETGILFLPSLHGGSSSLEKGGQQTWCLDIFMREPICNDLIEIDAWHARAE